MADIRYAVHKSWKYARAALFSDWRLWVLMLLAGTCAASATTLVCLLATHGPKYHGPMASVLVALAIGTFFGTRGWRAWLRHSKAPSPDGLW